MALIICTECNKEISSLAKSCPNCGFPIKSKIIQWDIENENKKKQEKRKFLESLDEKIPLRESKVRNAKGKNKNTGCFGALLIFLILVIIVIFNSTDNNDNSPEYTSKTSSKGISSSPSVEIKYSKVSLNVRKKPNGKSRVLKVLKPNEKVTTKGEQENGFTQILNSNNRIYGWCATKYLQDSPLSKSQLEEKELRKNENRKINYRIIEKKDIGLNRFNCKIEIQVDKIPNNDEFKKLGLNIWSNGYKQWGEFNLWMYLPDMDKNFAAYCLFEFSQNGLISSDFFSNRKAGEKIDSTNEIKKEFDVSEVDREDNNSGFVDPFSLKQGEKWAISKETPLMPEIAPSNPMEALEKIKYIPAENYIIIVSVREKENNTWYEVKVLNQNNNLIGKGWINSIALIGQTLQLVESEYATEDYAETNKAKDLANKKATKEQVETKVIATVEIIQSGVLRSNPSPIDSILLKLKKGTLVDVIDIENNYYKVLYKNHVGYINNVFIDGPKHIKTAESRNKKSNLSAAKSISLAKRKRIFYELVKYQDQTGNDVLAYFVIAERFNITVEKTREIGFEGLRNKWTMPK